MSIANYKEHREAFKTLLQPDCDKPILLFKGESGTGKTELLKYCHSKIHKDTPHALIGLTSLSVTQFFYQAGRCLGWQHFENFRENLAKLNTDRQVHINVNENDQAGMGNMINVELNAVFKDATLEQRKERYSLLTNAWSEDINSLTKPCVLLLDVYDKNKTPIETQEWISNDLLSCTAYSEKMRVVIAGQDAPENINWEHRCEIKELDGVHEAEAWLEFAKERGFAVPSPSPIELLRGFCIALNGNPSAIMKFIEKFPRLQ